VGRLLNDFEEQQMKTIACRCILLPVALLATSACAQAPQTISGGPLPSKPSEFIDQSPHKSGFVTSNGVRLHYLDWGGQGEAVVFLPGLGASAHAFDTLAPKLVDSFRVLALTPRAHGESATPDTTYTVADAAEDIRSLIDSLGIERTHLVGHSISGSAITRFAALHPRRVGKLVYLDATFDYGGSDEAEMDEKVLGRPWPDSGMSSMAEYREWARRYFYGTWSPALEAELWAGASVDTAERERRGKAQSALLADVTANPKEYEQVTAPALAFWAEKTLQTHYFWLDSANTDAVERAREYLRLRRLWEQRGVERFKRELSGGEAIAFPGHHWLFITDEEQVLRQLRSFLSH
jgi:pimeloyl-ACP methyl ester carboxylesterase